MGTKYVSLNDRRYCYLCHCRSDAADPLLQELRTETAALGKEVAKCQISDDQGTFLSILVAAWQVKEPPFGPGIAGVANGICADFAHDQGGSATTGFYRVGSTDLNRLVASWLVKEPPTGPGVPADCAASLQR